MPDPAAELPVVREPYCPYTKNPDATWSAPDVAKAKQLIADSGTKGQSVSVIINNDAPARNRRVLRVAADSLGYKGKLKALAASIEYSVAQNSSQNPQMTLSYWYPDYPDPADFFNIVYGCAGFHPNSNASPNLSEFCDQDVQTKTEAALKQEETNFDAAAPLWTAIDKQVTDLAPQISLFVPKNLVFVSKRVGNVQYSDSVVGQFMMDQATVN